MSHLSFPAGFLYAATYAGVRKKRQDDLALIVSQSPASAAAVFTTNRVQAAPLTLARKHLKASRGRVSAVLINAGNANCATRTGAKVALETARAVAKMLGVPLNQVIPSSTGVIGEELDARLITRSLPTLADKLRMDALDQVARAIMTTDTVPKAASAEVGLGKGRVRLAGVAKGSGMIMPNMATTLAFVMTDARIAPAPLKRMLREAAEVSFNRISVDGETSTNDTLLVMANGASGVAVGAQDRGVFESALTMLLQDLAMQIARDGEGAGKLITINVSGTANDDDAVRIARAIANSPLCKTAIHGNDPNWGRILSSAGASGAPLDPRKVSVRLQGTTVCKNGLATIFSEDNLKQKLNSANVTIDFLIAGSGRGQSRFWTCDMTEEYIKINASYRT